MDSCTMMLSQYLYLSLLFCALVHIMQCVQKLCLVARFLKMLYNWLPARYKNKILYIQKSKEPDESFKDSCNITKRRKPRHFAWRKYREPWTNCTARTNLYSVFIIRGHWSFRRALCFWEVNWKIRNEFTDMEYGGTVCTGRIGWTSIKPMLKIVSLRIQLEHLQESLLCHNNNSYMSQSLLTYK